MNTRTRERHVLRDGSSILVVRTNNYHETEGKTKREYAYRIRDGLGFIHDVGFISAPMGLIGNHEQYSLVNAWPSAHAVFKTLLSFIDSDREKYAQGDGLNQAAEMNTNIFVAEWAYMHENELMEMELNKTREDYEDMVKSPGLYEGEDPWAPYFYEYYLAGVGKFVYHADGDDNDALLYVEFVISDEDRKMWPELAEDHLARIYQDDQGYVSCEIVRGV